MQKTLLLAGMLALTSLAHRPAFGLGDQALDTVNVKVRAAKVRVEPKAWATAVTTLQYGDSIQAVSSADGWLKVRTAGGKQGYLHESAVTTKRILLSKKGVSGDGTADRADVVLAGKGFNRAVERDLAAQDSSLNFKGVDEMERLQVRDTELAAFMKAGQLGRPGQGV